MKSRITKTVALAALMAGATGVANATEGWYGRADAGYSFGGQVDIGEQIELENDWTQHLGLGYAFENGFRLEGELGHRFNQMTPDAPLITDGDIHAWSAMGNLFYDFNRGGGIEPYVGIGVGSARLNANATDGIDSVDDSDTVLAYQGMIGLAAALSDNLSLDVGYRYFVADGGEFDGTGGTLEADYEHQAVTVGLRYQFAAAAAPVVAPPPVAPPPPPPIVQAPPQAVACPTSEFVVYFEFNRSNLNQDGLATIDSAVARARQCNIANVSVVGHTDTSGSPAYNLALSERRASVVRDALVARGMTSEGINTAGTGESNLARPTADGVREPLNRRTAVTITFR
jgi:OmpA-OmpF porin, OOP family